MSTPTLPKSKSTEPDPLSNGVSAASNAGNVDKIRDILFGSNMREYDQRFAKLEERLLQEAAELREEIKKRIAALESFVKTETHALQADLKAARAERIEADRELGREQKEAQKILEKRASQLEEAAARTTKEWSQQLVEKTSRVSNDLEEKLRELSTHVARETIIQRDRATARHDLAELFELLSARLRDDSPKETAKSR